MQSLWFKWQKSWYWYMFVKEKHLSMEVYFVMPNVIVAERMVNGKEITVALNIVLVNLSNGCVISWDGTNICYCTSIWIDPNNHSNVFGEPEYGFCLMRSNIFYITLSTQLQVWSWWRKFMTASIHQKWVMQQATEMEILLFVWCM